MRTAVVVALVLFAATIASGDVLQVTVDGVIHSATGELIGRAIDEAKTRGDSAVLIRLATPGGLSDETRTIVHRIVTSPVPVIVYVSPSGRAAASAGFFILQAADVAAMAPGTNTGAAHPVMLSGTPDEVMTQKMLNDSAAWMRSIAARRGRNVAAAESAVRESKSFSEDEALQLKLIDAVARDEQELLRTLEGRVIRRFDGRTATLRFGAGAVRVHEMTLKQKVLAYIMDPNVAFILLSIGMLALWAEFNHPGAIFPGVVGVLCIVLSVFALNLFPIRYAAVALILLAIALFVLEAKFTSHGILGAGGVIAMFLGGLLLVDSPVPAMRVHWITALGVSLPFGIIMILLVTLAVRSRRIAVSTGSEGMIGETGVAKTNLDPAGKVFVHGELWDAVSEAGELREGDAVRVRSVEGLRLRVGRPDS